MTEPADRRCSVVVLISGSGSNLQSIIDACSAGRIDARVSAVISNRADAFGLQRAARADIPARVVDASGFASRADYDAELAGRIDAFRPDLVVLAGFMRILGPAFVRRYWGKMLNIHPSLLPKYRGLDTYRRVLEAGDSHHGTSVHYVTEELDGGPVVAQARVAIRPGDDEAGLSARVQAAEHKLYPTVIGWIASGRLRLRDDAPWLDDERLAEPVVFEDDT